MFKILALALFLHSQLAATLFSEIDTTKPLFCFFSLNHQNRIAVTDGRIIKVICPETELSIKMEEESGQVFIYPLNDSLSRVTLSVVTGDGLVQDLHITFIEKGPEVVILSAPTSQDSPREFVPMELVPAELVPTGLDPTDLDPTEFALTGLDPTVSEDLNAIQQIIDAVGQGRVPFGFTQCESRRAL